MDPNANSSASIDTVEAVLAFANFNTVSGEDSVTLSSIPDNQQYVSTSIPTAFQDWYNFNAEGVGQLVAASIQVQNSADKPIAKKRGPKKKTYQHTCSVCRKSFTNSVLLRDHLRTHTGEKPYVCLQCGISFAQNANLRMHYRTHTGEKPHVCKICGRGFARSTHLAGHLRTHTGEKPFSCTICSTAFITLQQLKNHVKSHTGERSWKCDICEASFTHSSSLSTHKKKIHYKVKPYKCHECNKGFYFPYNLKNHLSVHSGVRIQCDKCLKTYTNAQSLAIHQKKYCSSLKSSSLLPNVPNSRSKSGRRKNKKSTEESIYVTNFEDDVPDALVIKQQIDDSEAFVVERACGEDGLINHQAEENSNGQPLLRKPKKDNFVIKQELIEEFPESAIQINEHSFFNEDFAVKQELPEIPDGFNFADKLVLTIGDETEKKQVLEHMTFDDTSPLHLVISAADDDQGQQTHELLLR